MKAKTGETHNHISIEQIVHQLKISGLSEKEKLEILFALQQHDVQNHMVQTYNNITKTHGDEIAKRRKIAIGECEKAQREMFASHHKRGNIKHTLMYKCTFSKKNGITYFSIPNAYGYLPKRIRIPIQSENINEDLSSLWPEIHSHHLYKLLGGTADETPFDNSYIHVNRIASSLFGKSVWEKRTQRYANH